MSAALRAYMERRLAEAHRILAEPASRPTLRWLAEQTIREWEGRTK